MTAQKTAAKTSADHNESPTRSMISLETTSGETDTSKCSEFPRHWVSALFKKFQARYGHKWTTAIDGIEALAVSEWALALAGLNGNAIRAGIDAWVGGWPPTAPEFARLCRDCVAGAPSAEEAWRLACNARSRPGSLQHRYTHPMVLAAATHPAVDLYTWSQLPARKGLARFSAVYAQLLSRMYAGETFDWPDERPAIEDRSGAAVTPMERSASRRTAKRAIRCAKAINRGTNPATGWQRVHGMMRLS